jgi:hypothetical protein
VSRSCQNCRSGSGLNNLSGIHYRNPLTDFSYNTQIMADKNNTQPGRLAKFGQQVKNLCLSGDVEGGGRFVSYEDLGTARQCQGDNHPLAQTAGKLVRICIQYAGTVRDAGLSQKRMGQGLQIPFSLVSTQALQKMTTYAHQGIESAHGILENHRQAAPAER